MTFVASRQCLECEAAKIATCGSKSDLSAGLSAREVELINGMIEVQLNHAGRCDRIANREMAEKQKGWDMERVELLRKVLRVMGR